MNSFTVHGDRGLETVTLPFIRHLVFACLVLAVVGCSESPAESGLTPTNAAPSAPASTQTAASLVPEGWTLHEVPSAGLSIALPPDWETLELNRQSVEAAVAEVRGPFGVARLSPNLAQRVEREIPRLLDTLQLWGFDADATARYDMIPNVQVTKVRLPKSMSLGQLSVAQLDSLLTGFKDNLAGKPGVEYSRISAGRALIFRFQLDFTPQDGAGVSLAGTQYVLLKEPIRSETAYGLYFDSLAEDDARNQELYRQIADTFEILE